MIRYFEELPKPSKHVMFMLCIGIALGISVRISAIILSAYFLLFSILYYLFNTPFSEILSKVRIKQAGKLILYWFVISLCGYFLGILFWPYGLADPIDHTLEVINATGDFPVKLRVLFDGDMHWSDLLPWYYTSMFIFITTPVVILAGSLLFVILLFIANKYYSGRYPLYIFILVFAAVFPLIYMGIKDSYDYGGWRHFLFIYPPLVIISAIGYEILYKSIKRKYLKLSLLVIFALLLFHPVGHIVRNDPYQYIYFNEFTGGVKKAYGKYELDYYCHSIKHASQWLLNYLDNNHDRSEKLTIVTNRHEIVSYCFKDHKDRYTVKYCKYYGRNWFDWDYAIFNGEYIHYHQLQNDLWPPKGTIHTIRVDNKPVSAILKRESRAHFLGKKALDKKEYETAGELLKKAVEYDPNHEASLLSLSEYYMYMEKFEKAKELIQKCLEVYPGYEVAYSYLSQVCLYENKPDQSVKYLEKALETNPYYYQAYLNLGVIYFNNQQYEKAIAALEKCISLNPRFKMAYPYLINTYTYLKNEQKANYYRQILKNL